MTQINANAPDLELDLARKLFWLMCHDFVFFGTYNSDKQDWDDGIYPAINCSDVFVAGADAEKLSLEDLDKYILVCKKYIKLYPEYLWCIAKRSEKPWRNDTKFSEEELEALDFICDLLGTKNPVR